MEMDTSELMKKIIHTQGATIAAADVVVVVAPHIADKVYQSTL